MRFLTILGVWLLPIMAAADVERLIDSRWYQVDSPNIRIVSNGEPQQLEKLARELEAFRVATQGLMGLSGTSQRLTIVAAADRATYAALVGEKMSRSTGGVYSNTVGGSYALINMDERRFYALHPAREFLFHEYTHFLTFTSDTQRYPYWYREGFAELLSTMSFTDDGRFRIGQPPASRAATLVNARPMPLEQLLRLTPGEVRKRDMADLYASGWMLTHWLLLSSGKAAEFSDYLRRYEGGADPVAALEAALSMPIADIEDEYRRQFRNDFPLRTAAMPSDYRAPAVTVDVLAKPQAIREIAQYLAYAPFPNDRLRSLVQEISGAGSEILELKAILAGAEIAGSELDRAERILASIPETQRDGIWFRSSQSWLRLYRHLDRETETSDKDVLKSVRDQFVYLVNNDDERATHWYGLALSMKTLGYPPEKYTEMLEQAYFRAPRETTIALELAKALYRQKNTDYFTEVATPLLMDLDGRPEAERLRRMFAELTVEESRD